MKRVRLNVLVLLFMTLAINSTFAQVTPTDPSISGDIQTPHSINGLAKFIVNRFHTISFGVEISEMKNAANDGVIERKMVAVFNAEGALVYNHEMAGSDEGVEIVGKNAGWQAVPYTLSVTQDGRVFFSVSAFAAKNMNSANNTIIDIDYGEKISSDAWSVIDEVSFLVYEMDKNYSLEGLTTHTLKIASIDAKMDILGSSKPGTFLAITAGADFRGVWQYYSNNLLPGMDIYHESDNNPGSTWGANVRYGLEFNTNLSNGWRINLSAKATQQFLNNSAIKVINADYTQYLQEKQLYEAAEKGGNVLTDTDYLAETGKTKPSETLSAKRELFFVTPSLSVSKGFKSKNGKYPMRLGLNIYSNITIKDNLHGGIFQDLKDSQREYVGGKLFLNF